MTRGSNCTSSEAYAGARSRRPAGGAASSAASSGEPERSQFEAAYTKLVDAAYPRRPDGKTLFPFRRLFIIATKA